MNKPKLSGPAPPLAGQVALVTGAARRIGREIALTLAEAGARVAVNYHSSAAEAEKTAAEIRAKGGRAVALEADVSSAGQVQQLVEAVEEKLGPVDILVNNAGVFAPGEWDKITEEDWDLFMNVNLKSQFLCAQAVARGMKRRGSGKIVNLASLGGVQVWSGYIPYSVSKAGVIQLTRLLARALVPEVQVNAVAPGTIQFPGEEADRRFIERAPLKMAGEARDIASAVLFFCTGSDFITGQILAVDGGYSLT
ncbi:MAG: SDR family NAD(P)-dependent oxidoreductase [Candidatus Acidiferrales bacterium]